MGFLCPQDEFTCIGCKQCVWAASATFRIEQEHGRSRVYAQWLDDEDKIQSAIGELQRDDVMMRMSISTCKHVLGATADEARNRRASEEQFSAS